MKQIDMTNVTEAGESRRLPAGAYVCIIRKVEDFPDKEYLKITYDIFHGDYTNYFDDLRAAHPDWAWCGAYARSYKPSALGMFKRFCSAVSKTNGAYIFDAGSVNADEQTLVGKVVGIVLQEEEYYGNDGTKRTRLIVNREFSFASEADVAAQKVPDVKRISNEPAAPRAESFVNVTSSAEVPF